MKETVLVTGATGTVGTQVVKHLAAAGVTVRAAVHRPDRMPGTPGVEMVAMDMGNAASMTAAMDGVDRVFLLTPFVDNMVELTRRLTEAAAAAKVGHLVKLSAYGAGPNPIMELSRWHTAAEQVVVESGIPFTVLRPNTFMQNYVGYHAASIRAQNAFYLPQGEGRMSLVDVRDIAAVATTVLTRPDHAGRYYTLTGPAAISNGEIAEILSRVLGRTIRYVSVSEADARTAMQQSGAPGWMVDALMELNAINRAGQAATVYPDVETVTGRKATSFDRFAQDHADAFR